MFNVKISPLVDECVNLNQQVYELNNQTYEVAQMIRKLQEMEGFEGFISKLRTENSKFELNINVLNQMSRVLDKTILYYLNCENKICENGEQSTIRFKKKDRVSNDLNGIVNAVNSIALF